MKQRKEIIMTYELVVIWSNGDKDIYEYNSEDKAIEASEGMKVALGNQIAWTGVRRKVV